MNSPKLKKLIVAVFLVSLNWPILASAAPGDIKIGRLEIRPSFGMSFEYNDNVFLEADKTFANGTSEGFSDDFIIRNLPSVSFLLPRQKQDFFGFELNYSGVDEHYIDLGPQDKFNHDLNGAMLFGGPGGRVDARLSGGFQDTQLPSSSEFASNFNPILSREYTFVRGDVDIKLSRLFSSHIYTERNNNEFSSAILSFENKQSVQVGGDIFYQLRPLVSIGLKYGYEVIDYDTPGTVNSDSDTHSVSAAVRWAPTALVAGEIYAGYNTREYDAVTGQDRDSGAYGINLSYSPTKRTSLTLSGNRSVQDSTFSTVQAFVSTSVNLLLKQKILTKFSADLGVGYQNADYDIAAVDVPGGGVTKFRDDDLFNAQATLNYQIQKWLGTSIGYFYQDNDSNFNDRDYGQNSVKLTVLATF